MAAEPPPRWFHFSAGVERQLCVYGGQLGGGESELPTTVHAFSFKSEEWKEAATTARIHPPPNLRDGACTSTDSHVFIHGGYDGRLYYNSLYQLDCRDLKWTKLSSAGDQGAPMAKDGHRMVYHAQTDSLLVFGGYGPQPTGPTQPGAEYQVDRYGGVHTNELHMFHLQEGKCLSDILYTMLYAM